MLRKLLRLPGYLYRCWSFRRHYVNIKDHGAKGDGETDNRGAIDAAYQAAAQSGKRGILIPPGTWVTTRPGTSSFNPSGTMTQRPYIADLTIKSADTE